MSLMDLDRNRQRLSTARKLATRAISDTAWNVSRIPAVVKGLSIALDDEHLALTMGFLFDRKDEKQEDLKVWADENIPDEMKTVEYWTEKAKPTPEFIAGVSLTAVAATCITGNNAQAHNITDVVRVSEMSVSEFSVMDFEDESVTVLLDRELTPDEAVILKDAVEGSDVVIAVENRAFVVGTEFAEDFIEVTEVTDGEFEVAHGEADEADEAGTVAKDKLDAETTQDGFTVNGGNWTDGSAYTHDIATVDDSITAEVLDAYLSTTRFDYDPQRVNGEKLLEWQRISGVDVKAIIAKAIWESNLGTAGVAATVPGCNMFGYGAFDADPANCRNYSDDETMRLFGQNVRSKPYWRSFAKMDEAAQIAANGGTPDGGVYYSDTSGTGERRAQTMAQIKEFADGFEEREALRVSAQMELSRQSLLALQDAPNLTHYATSVEGFANGEVPVEVLVRLTWADGHVLRGDAAAQFEKLNKAFTAAFGEPISVTDSYRSFERQVRLKRDKPHLAAKPGTSQHGWGIAVDLGSGINSFGTPQHKWMAEHGAKFGWFHPAWAQADGAKPEPWHWEFSADLAA